ncbi:hypothetical protein RIR_jg37736.t2 [Rhizophagus irregularis DAOM 181602=DAOM 197198]|nr:hypothetical protein RIR_jg37736.t2 [Rhizophagus irregularis DAOM 181602=DAOM 197198]
MGLWFLAFWTYGRTFGLLTRCILTDSLDYFFNERSSFGFGFGSMDSNSKLSVALQKLQDRSDGLMRISVKWILRFWAENGRFRCCETLIFSFLIWKFLFLEFHICNLEICGFEIHKRSTL